ncbi:60S ribosomal protein L14 [Trichinella sp. T8]|nr:60S ribosomal protein L14 [Trichinella sp. T8]
MKTFRVCAFIEIYNRSRHPRYVLKFKMLAGIFDVLVQIGRVIYIARGRERGKLAVIVNVVDGNRALVDGPGLKRQMINFKNMLLTKMTLKITHYDKTKAIIAAWEKANINELWSKTKLAQSRRRRALRAKMSDFDRFKLMKAKQAVIVSLYLLFYFIVEFSRFQRNRILKREFERVKILHKRAEKKAKQSRINCLECCKELLVGNLFCY